MQNTDKRVIFINPYERRPRLIGTTDIPLDGDPDDGGGRPSRRSTICCGVLNRYFQRQIGPQDVVHSFAGRAAALRRRRRQPLGRHPRLCLRRRCTRAAGRRSCRCSAARSRPSASWPSMRWTGCARSSRRWARPGPRRRRCPAATCPVPISTRWLAEFRRAPSLAAGGPGAALRPALRHARRRAAGRRAGRWPISAGISAALLYEREAPSCARRNGPRTAEDILWRRTKHGLHLSPAETAAFTEWLEAAPAPAVQAMGR